MKPCKLWLPVQALVAHPGERALRGRTSNIGVPSRLGRQAAPPAMRPTSIFSSRFTTKRSRLSVQVSRLEQIVSTVFLRFISLKMSKYATWNLQKLREELKKRGKTQSGRKKDLAERWAIIQRCSMQLLNHSSSFDFRLECLDTMGVSVNQDYMLREFWLGLPDITTYTDVHAGTQVPAISMDSIVTYLQANNQVFETKCKEMYEQRWDSWYHNNMYNHT